MSTPEPAKARKQRRRATIDPAKLKKAFTPDSPIMSASALNAASNLWRRTLSQLREPEESREYEEADDVISTADIYYIDGEFNSRTFFIDPGFTDYEDAMWETYKQQCGKEQSLVVKLSDLAKLDPIWRAAMLFVTKYPGDELHTLIGFNSYILDREAGTIRSR